MNQIFTLSRKSIFVATALVLIGFYVSAQIAEPVFNWNFEAGKLLLDEGTAQKNLTAVGTINTGGTEPGSPPFGSVGAVLDAQQYMTLSNADYGNRCLNGTDLDGTIYVSLRTADQLRAASYVISKYNIKDGHRQFALSIQGGSPFFLWGTSGGNTNSVTESMGFTADPEEDIVLALSLDANTKTYTYLAYEVDRKIYYKTSNEIKQLGAINTNGPEKLVIGNRGDAVASRYFPGIVYWARIYDEAHTVEQMKSIIGEGIISSAKENKLSGSELGQNYPNPFSGETTISYTLQKAAFVTVDIFNITGQKVRSLINAQQQASTYTVKWDARNDMGQAMPGGIYFYNMKAGENSLQTHKMLLLK